MATATAAPTVEQLYQQVRAAWHRYYVRLQAGKCSEALYAAYSRALTRYQQAIASSLKSVK